MSDEPTNQESPAEQPADTPSSSAMPTASQAASLPWGCRPSLEELYKYMDGVMEPDRQNMVTSHLDDCSGCDDFFHFHTGLRQLIGQRCQSELPRDLPTRVFRAITDLP